MTSDLTHGCIITLDGNTPSKSNFIIQDDVTQTYNKCFFNTVDTANFVII